MPPPHLELDDLVRLPDDTLALVDRLPSSDSESDSDEDSDDDQSIIDHRGRLSNWVHNFAFPSSPSNLITSYDDPSTPAADDHAEETPQPREPHYHPHQHVPEGSALVAVALTGTYSLYPTTSLTPVDRSFHGGSLVIRATNSTQSGIIQSVRKTLLVRRVQDITPLTANQPDQNTVFQIQASQLGYFSGLRSGDAVVRGNWVGMVDYFQEDVFVQFPDGAIACVPGHQRALRNIDPRTPDRKGPGPFREGLYYPGQRVRGVPEVWRTIAVWIRGKYTGLNEGVVKSVSLGDVGVEWIAKNMCADDADDPSSINPGERNVENVKYWEITPLDEFHDSDWVVGDRAFLIDQKPFLHSSANPDRHREGPNGASSSLTHADKEDCAMGDAHEDDGEWEEDSTSGEDEGEESRPQAPRNGRLIRAHRRARELTRIADETGVISESLMTSPSASAEDVVQILQTTTIVDVLWQDGSRSVGIPGLDVQRANHSDSYDFWPGQIVSRLDDGLSDDENGVANPLKRRGVLVSMDNSQRTAIVRWENEEGMQFDGKEEELSVYELIRDESNVGIGDVVLHAPTRQDKNACKEWVGIVKGLNIGNCTVSWFGGTVSDVPHSELIFLTTEDMDDSDDSEESSDEEEDDTSIGEAVEHDYDDENDTNWGPDVDDDDGVSSSGVAIGRGTIRDLVVDFQTSQNCRINFMPDNVTLAVQVAVEEAADMLDIRKRRRKDEGSEIRMSHDDMRLLANFLVTRTMSQLLFSSVVQRPELRTNHHIRSEVVQEWETLKSALIIAFDSLASEDCSEPHETMASDGEVREHGESSERMQIDAPDTEVGGVVNHGEDTSYTTVNERGSSDSGISLTSRPIERFMVVDNLADFHKFSSVPSGSTPSLGFLSVVNKEWVRLQRSLPSGIMVRASEQQRDRIRAAIVGPEGTPYASIMFFFDILMGHKYPFEPPHVWFRSHGRRLNPNLYEDGKVCLSILGTWDGDSIESWDSKTSNLLRVLLSLQALVFVDEPYYNEAGYQKHQGTHEGHVNSQVYNESAFLLCIRHMLQTLKKGTVPSDCADMATAHYRRVGCEILQRCRALVNSEAVGKSGGAEVGNSGELSDLKAYSSCGFKRSLGQVIPAVEKALASLDVDVSST